MEDNTSRPGTDTVVYSVVLCSRVLIRDMQLVSKCKVYLFFLCMNIILKIFTIATSHDNDKNGDMELELSAIVSK